MRLPRSTVYDAPSLAVDDAEIIGRMQAICDEFETYGYRRVGAALRQQGVVVNAKKVRRLMRAHDLHPRINTLRALSKPRLEPVHSQGRTPETGLIRPYCTIRTRKENVPRGTLSPTARELQPARQGYVKETGTFWRTMRRLRRDSRSG